MSDQSELVPFRLRRAPSPLDPRNNADAFDIRLLTRRPDLVDAFRLRHRAYANQGLIPLASGEEYRDDHDDLPTTAILGGFDNGRLVASMRLCFSFPSDPLASLPCAPYYPALGELKIRASHGLAEVSRLCIEPEIGNTSYRATLYGFMVRSAFAAARAADISAIVVATRPDWVSYYKHLLSFEQVGTPALYPPGGIPITLLAGHIDQASRRAQMRNRFFRVSDEDVSRMQRMLAPVLEPQSTAVASGGER
jgi:N-acyl-L-homoserine lactone synthetase